MFVFEWCDSDTLYIQFVFISEYFIKTSVAMSQLFNYQKLTAEMASETKEKE